MLLALTGVVVLVMGRFETLRADDRPAPAMWKPILAAVTVIAGLAVMASVGVVGESGVTWWWPLLPVAGMVGFGVVRASVPNPNEKRQHEDRSGAKIVKHVVNGGMRGVHAEVLKWLVERVIYRLSEICKEYPEDTSTRSKKVCQKDFQRGDRRSVLPPFAF